MQTRLFKEKTVNSLNHQDIYKETLYSLYIKVGASVSVNSLRHRGEFCFISP